MGRGRQFLFVVGRQLRRGTSFLWRRRKALAAVFTRRRRILWRLCVLCAVLGVLTVGLSSHVVGRAAQGRLFDLETAPSRQVAIVFGAGVFPNGTLTAPLQDRVWTAVQLYRLGKVRKLLMSGDNGQTSYDEPTAMREYAVAKGIPLADVALDYAGFHTYDTCYRAREVFAVKSATLITQAYHLPRALFTCQSLGIDVIGIPADRHSYRRYLWYLLREQISRARAYFQVRVFRPRPRFLGPQIPIAAATSRNFFVNSTG